MPTENGAATAPPPPPPGASRHAVVLVLDYGSQYTQLIARRVREKGVYSMLLPGDATLVRGRRRTEARKKQAGLVGARPSVAFALSAFFCIGA
jgi:hypothetical protein